MGEPAVAPATGDPVKGSRLVRPGDRFDTREVFEIVKANQDCYSVSTMCRLLGVSSSGYHAWKHRAPSPRAMADAALLERIRAIHHRSRATYGIPRIHAELVDEGFRIGRKRVARLMRLAGLQGVSRCKGGRTTIRGKEMQVIPDLVNRNFRTTAPDQLWVADIIYPVF